MYIPINVIVPTFNGIYQTFISDLTTTVKREKISYEVKKALLLISGFKAYANEATDEQIKSDLQTVNDLLIKFSGIYANAPKDSELKINIQQVNAGLQEVKKMFLASLDTLEYKEEKYARNKRILDTWGGEDADYEEFSKMPTIE